MKRNSLKRYILPAFVLVVFEIVAITLWLTKNNIFYLFNFSYIGISITLGLVLFAQNYKHARRVVQLLVGLYMLIYLGLICNENMQIEGFWYYLFTGVFEAATIHYAVAKIFGPLIFGRGWCGYACWTAMVLDFLPYKIPDHKRRKIDMYPLYWTPSRGGIIMRYTYEYKRKCVELYREGKWPETPEGVSDKSFRDKVRLWVRAEDSRGPEALKHKNFNRNWTPEERLELVSQVMSGKSCVSVAIEAGIQDRLLYQWVQNYKTKGYNGLVEMKKGRPSKGVPQMKKEEARPLNESEREELIRLRAENEYIKAENEVIKKEIALREERHAAQLKARKQRSSKSCVKKDTN